MGPHSGPASKHARGVGNHAALLSGRLDATWARWSRPWTTAAWVSLTLGIALGSWWAYYELGWGGWWFWDPVENASFMPWLFGTALLHSAIVVEKRDALKSWTVLLAIITFALSLLGTFLVRSGVITSVHAFATDPARGLFILLLLGLAIGGSLALFETVVPPNVRVPAPHRHVTYDETVHVLEGTCTFTVEGSESSLGPGQALFIPRGAAHHFENRGAETVRMLVTVTPGVLSSEFFREAAAVMAAGGPPDLKRIAEIMERHGLQPV